MSPAGPLPAVAPNPTPDDEAFWQAASDGRLLLPRCRQCLAFVWYPRAFCPACHTADVEWVASTGDGTVYSFTVNTRGYGAWADVAPYVIAYVELDEGPRVLTNIVDVDPQEVHIGQRVTAVFQPAGDAARVLRFAPRAGD